MKTKTSHLGFLIATLIGLAFGLRLASQVGGAHGGDQRGVSHLLDEATGTDDSRVANGSALEELERATAGNRHRPTPDHRDHRFTPHDGETCVAFRIDSEDGAPLSNAHAALFAVEDDRPRFPADAESKSDSNGIVYARTEIAGELYVTAFAPGFQPLTRRVKTSAIESLELSPFVLQRGATIRGRVTAGDTALPRAEIEATVDATGDPAKLEGGSIAWRLGHFAWSNARTETAADGSYEFSGLDAGPHTLRIRTVRQRNVAIDVSKVQPLHALAPDPKADFDVPAARLELSFKTSSAPLCCVEVQIEAGDRQFTRRTDENGQIAMMIQPALAYPVTAGRGGYTTMHTQLHGLIDGERSAHTIELEPQKVLATVIVDDQETAGGPSGVFTFHPRFPAQGNVDFTRTVTRDPESKKFKIEGVPSGPWRLTLRGGQMLQPAVMDVQNPTTPLYLNCDADTVVDVPASGSVDVTMSVVTRGYARVNARNALGQVLDVRPRMFDGDGDELEVVLTRGRDQAAPWGIQANASERTNFVYSTLCGGPVDLLLARDGFEDAKVRIVLQPGQITPVDVTMHPR